MFNLREVRITIWKDGVVDPPEGAHLIMSETAKPGGDQKLTFVCPAYMEKLRVASGNCYGP